MDVNCSVSVDISVGWGKIEKKWEAEGGNY